MKQLLRGLDFSYPWWKPCST